MLREKHGRDFQQYLQVGNLTPSWIFQPIFVLAHEKTCQPDRKSQKESHEISKPIERIGLWIATKGTQTSNTCLQTERGTLIWMYKLTNQFFDSNASDMQWGRGDAWRPENLTWELICLTLNCVRGFHELVELFQVILFPLWVSFTELDLQDLGFKKKVLALHHCWSHLVRVLVMYRITCIVKL